ncbi:4-hydroxythreonine-4-phosphate dehydrogenase PdxA [Pseudobutyrivibrio sp.]|uniref:4-hydroxythreonine-4-phosphate dehydrogenase PdxA n=1 Tax=Pseudobutyrivibrio sp. TaxID=2014367 RepID=UPI001DCEFECE|nr:4-hydroxythreonine-4-phosphate dehydrogenase PdxA [Pseudobutyrivibrio sp.]MBE5909942.1 4-hydroxythreonine-4-phosphate dehydrogenase PdxA [Pseudobutyrivibrio sp.]
MNISYKPITALTMGDPAGIGPEICLGTMLDKEIHNVCRPFIIGSIAILDRAAKVLNKQVEFRKIDSPKEARYDYGTIDVLETGDYDTDSIKWGEVQELAGRMAYDFILKSIELGMAKEVDAVSTAPIHKQAIKLIGVKEPGHTEIYQHKTNSEYALTMFSCHKLRVFFVSRHMSLMDACKFASKDEILKDVRYIDKELRNVGISDPIIAVAGLNPHNGDNGLFGTEEITDIGPAVEAAKELGINCIGPCPADSVFNIGKSGKFDAILSLYHDQGHIACKTLDFEKSVTLTFGLPFIRSSVDHGTAFDIAGKGIAGSISMIESTKVVSEYAAKQHEKIIQNETENKKENVKKLA